MLIGELARRLRVNIQTIRFYEREGLLRPPSRTSSGYRSYSEKDVARIRFIRRCQGLGFSLREVRHLATLHGTDADEAAKMAPAAMRQISALAAARLQSIDEKILALKAMREQLTRLHDALRQNATGRCPVSR